jgi:hypothetical protein
MADRDHQGEPGAVQHADHALGERIRPGGVDLGRAGHAHGFVSFSSMAQVA